MPSDWKVEIVECGDLVQDDDEVTSPEEAARRWNRYVELADSVTGREGAEGVAAIVSSLKVEEGYGAYQAAHAALSRFPPSDLGKGMALAADNRDRVTKVSSTNATVTYSYDGDGNVKTRTDASGTTGWHYDKPNRESIRTLQNGAQTALAYTPGGDVDYYTDPTGKTDYTWDKAGRLNYLTAPDGKKTDFDYNENDKRTKTVYPGGTTEAVGIDDNGRPESIKTTSGTTTLIDLAYSYKNTAGKDTPGVVTLLGGGV